MGARQAKWRRDPLNRFTYRFWNGSKWTEWVSTDGITTTDPITARDLPVLLWKSVESARDSKSTERRLPPARDPHLDGSESLAPPRREDRIAHHTTRAICESRFGYPEVDRGRVSALVAAHSLHTLIREPPSGWSKDRQAPQFPPVTRLTVPDDCTPERVSSIISDWRQRETERDEATAKRITEWEAVVRDSWVQLVLAEEVLRELDHPSGKLISQHNTLLGRLESMQLSRSTPDEQLASRQLTRESLINDAIASPKVIRTLLSSTLEELKGVSCDVDEGVLRRRVGSIREDIERSIGGTDRASTLTRRFEEPPSWSTWLTAARKYLAKYGPEGPGPRLTRFDQQRIKRRLTSVVNETRTEIQQQLSSLTESLATADTVRQITRPSGNPSSRASRKASDLSNLRSEMDSATDVLRRQVAELRTLQKWVKVERESLLKALTRVYLPTTLFDSEDRIDLICQSLEAQPSQQFNDHSTVVQKAAHDHWIRRCAADAAKREKQRQETRRASDHRKAIGRLTDRLLELDQEIQRRTNDMPRLREAVETARKRARRAKEDLDLLPAGSQRQRSLKLRLLRAEEDLAEAVDRANIANLKKERAEVERRLASATAELQSSSGSGQRGPAPSVGFVADSHEFEKFLASWMRWAGWPDAHVMPIGPDGGVDVRATGALGQAKYWDKPIGIEEVQRHNGVCEGIPNKGRIFLSKNGYTPDAVKFANAAGIVLLAMDTDKSGRAKAIGISHLAKSLLLELG